MYVTKNLLTFQQKDTEFNEDDPVELDIETEEKDMNFEKKIDKQLICQDLLSKNHNSHPIYTQILHFFYPKSKN